MITVLNHFIIKIFSNFREETKNWYDCLVPKCLSESLVPYVHWEKLKRAWMYRQLGTFLAVLALFLFKTGKYLAIDVALPGYDVITDCLAAYGHYQ